MGKPDILDEIIDQLSPEKIPNEFILLAKVRTYDGSELILSGIEFEEMMRNDRNNVSDIRVILDVKKVRLAITTETNRILEAVHAL